jgi:hypothetical protein
MVIVHLDRNDLLFWHNPNKLMQQFNNNVVHLDRMITFDMTK